MNTSFTPSPLGLTIFGINTLVPAGLVALPVTAADNWLVWQLLVFNALTTRVTVWLGKSSETLCVVPLAPELGGTKVAPLSVLTSYLVAPGTLFQLKVIEVAAESLTVTTGVASCCNTATTTALRLVLEQPPVVETST